MPGAIEEAGEGDVGARFIPGIAAGMGEVDGAAVAGAVVMPGSGALVGAVVGLAVIPGIGAIVFAGAGVPIGMPGIGAMVGWTAMTGAVGASARAATKV